jgi:hypothetical protein
LGLGRRGMIFLSQRDEAFRDRNLDRAAQP